MNGKGTFTWSDGTQKSGIGKMESCKNNVKEDYLNKIKELPEHVKQLSWFSHISYSCDFIFLCFKYHFWRR